MANAICKLYITVIRGTPTLVQLLIMNFIVLLSSTKVTVAVITFGINSGAYVAEIIRGGIMGVDSGQMEAGRSLGLSYVTTMKDIVLPQAMKSALPALINEMITLLKETSICGYIGLNELTRGGDIVRGITFEAMFPLFTVAAIYLIMVLFIQWIMGKVERRLRNSDHRLIICIKVLGAMRCFTILTNIFTPGRRWSLSAPPVRENPHSSAV